MPSETQPKCHDWQPIAGSGRAERCSICGATCVRHLDGTICDFAAGPVVMAASAPRRTRETNGSD